MGQLPRVESRLIYRAGKERERRDGIQKSHLHRSRNELNVEGEHQQKKPNCRGATTRGEQARLEKDEPRQPRERE
jgi:hypothetical protein